jgi:hypothetical protein
MLRVIVSEGVTMEETLTFWLDNKICSGFKVCEIGPQTLVSYRDKFYIIVRGAALMKGVRPLHYSKTSLPLVWKKALKGILPAPAAAQTLTEDDMILPATTSPKKEYKPVKKNLAPPAEMTDIQTPEVQPVQTAVKKAAPSKISTEVKPMKIIQAAVAATCPYCNHKQEIPFEKGRNGKPFFTPCSKCAMDFAVRFVPVTVYQAQVAAFK